MDFVMQMRGWNMSQWANEAGLRERTNVRNLMQRMKKHPERIAGDINTFAKLADAAKVTVDWLALGRGSPFAVSLEVPDDPRYPSRPGVLAVGHWLGFPKAAIEAVAAHEEPQGDPGTQFWFELLQLKRTQVLGASRTAESQRGE